MRRNTASAASGGLPPGLLLLGLVLGLNGCAHRPINARLTETPPTPGYYFHTQPRVNNSDETLFVVTFSGGGTRAAALACGVLEELARTPIGAPTHPHRLLDEVDAISSVSGGSVTAAAFGLYGDRAFEVLEKRFLKRNVQGALLSRTLNPLNWPRIWSPYFGRSDLAAEYYDRLLFNRATFGNLHRQPGPYLVINATDISTGARFSFTQYQFDLICSELSSYPLSRAVAASSAVPAVLSPITVNNYAGACADDIPTWLRDPAHLSSRARFHAAELRSYLDSTNRPYLHLVDGGVSDNMGLRAVLDGLFIVESSPDAVRYYDLDRLKRIVVLCVNAYSSPGKDWDRHEAPPGMLDLVLASAIIPIDRYSYESIELVKEQIERWRRERHQQSRPPGAPAAALPELGFYPIHVTFADVPSREERRYFMEQPTSFRLPGEAVDRLREVGGRLLRHSASYRELVRDLGGTLPETPPAPPPLPPAASHPR